MADLRETLAHLVDDVVKNHEIKWFKERSGREQALRPTRPTVADRIKDKIVGESMRVKPNRFRADEEEVMIHNLNRRPKRRNLLE